VTFSIAIFAKSITREKSALRESKRWKRPGQGAFDD
jgi:hypothetical protein